MLKKANLIYLIFAASLFSSCKKEFLDKKPQVSVVDENFYKTDQDMIAAINAAYDPLTMESDRLGQQFCLPFLFGDVVSDDALKGGSGDPDQVNFDYFEKFDGKSSFPELLLVWQKNYTGIYRANLVLQFAPKSNASETTKNRVMAEAKFLRAYYHFELVKMFGDVPVVTKVLNPDEYTLEKSPKADVYKQIEADLTEALVLPNKGQIELGRATKGAALALLARVQLYQTRDNSAKWSEVLKNAEAVINSGIYDLETDYSTIHSLAKENGIESVFEIQFTAGVAGRGGDNNSNWGSGNEGTFFNVMTRGRDNGGWGFNCPTKSLLDEFKKEKTKDDKEDPRLKATIIQDGDLVGTEVYKASASNYPFTGTYCRKYVESDKLSLLNPSDGPSNYRIIRFADVLLMAAEAANELGQSENALKYLNRVRARVNMADKTETNKDLLRDIIWRERRVELALEGHRFFDLVRQGRAASVMKATPEGGKFKEGIHEIFPIPLQEVQLSKGKISQNKGYF
ncbi:MAG: RagB/SusD family nutrient uptake outer membrane protein [Sporocytophaga sp.]|uniref:RagB/SusD family nutrient uptake outer membrane protein n=1 Tax=Sporocytophaga sp. TaxID=2231183 RepID=UPI001B1C4887|nr:RagB/SusD family nutrient uptake outer membrane protein [Sporocytophaga sp.]MBO9701478.1 RagB/SusD family nutrient uptake outer membrane protein [Sporocytophaga sp.]